MSFLNKHKTEAAVNTAPAADGLTGTAEDVDAVMKKYDRESNVRVWEGKPKTVIRFLMAAFSLFCIYLTLVDKSLPEVRLSFIPGHDHCHRIFKLSDQKRSCPREPHSMV